MNLADLKSIKERKGLPNDSNSGEFQIHQRILKLVDGLC